jgi:hypothetical protein
MTLLFSAGPGHCNNLFVLSTISEKILGGRSQGRAVQFYETLARTKQRLGDLKEAAAVCGGRWLWTCSFRVKVKGI